jgi:hypothetical protein
MRLLLMAACAVTIAHATFTLTVDKTCVIRGDSVTMTFTADGNDYWQMGLVAQTAPTGACQQVGNGCSYDILYSYTNMYPWVWGSSRVVVESTAGLALGNYIPAAAPYYYYYNGWNPITVAVGPVVAVATSCGCTATSCNLGTCTSNVCDCTATGGFTGDSCQACSASSCGIGVCTTGACNCDGTGFSGFACQTCSASSCGAGTCNSATGLCNCPAGIVGPACNMCSTTASCNGGACNAVSGVCDCTGTGHFGNTCACTVNCANGGACNDANPGTCVCVEGWSGTTCTVPSAAYSIGQLPQCIQSSASLIVTWTATATHAADLIAIVPTSSACVVGGPLSACIASASAVVPASVASGTATISLASVTTGSYNIFYLSKTSVHARSSTAVTVQPNSCCSSPCFWGGTCVDLNTCLCPAGYSGAYCQQTPSGIATFTMSTACVVYGASTIVTLTATNGLPNAYSSVRFARATDTCVTSGMCAIQSNYLYSTPDTKTGIMTGIATANTNNLAVGTWYPVLASYYQSFVEVIGSPLTVSTGFCCTSSSQCGAGACASGICDCTGTGYTGSTCNVCASSAACNGGACNAVSGACDCTGTGRFGSTCACTVNCANGGTCNAAAPGTCACIEGWSAATCTVPSAAYSIGHLPQCVKSSNLLTVSWTALSGHAAGDFIAILPTSSTCVVGGPITACASAVFVAVGTSAASGTTTLSLASLPDGSYNAFYLSATSVHAISSTSFSSRAASCCSSACLNGGTCADINTCSCPAGFSGAACQNTPFGTPTITVSKTCLVQGSMTDAVSITVTKANPNDYNYAGLLPVSDTCVSTGASCSYTRTYAYRQNLWAQGSGGADGFRITQPVVETGFGALAVGSYRPVVTGYYNSYPYSGGVTEALGSVVTVAGFCCTSSSQCGHGTCASGICDCTGTTFTGSTCQTCTAASCGTGTCVGGTCNCAGTGFFGPTCACTTNCANGGTCNPAAPNVCVCANFFTGATCQIAPSWSVTTPASTCSAQAAGIPVAWTAPTSHLVADTIVLASWPLSCALGSDVNLCNAQSPAYAVGAAGQAAGTTQAFVTTFLGVSMSVSVVPVYASSGVVVALGDVTSVVTVKQAVGDCCSPTCMHGGTCPVAGTCSCVAPYTGAQCNTHPTYTCTAEGICRGLSVQACAVVGANTIANWTVVGEQRRAYDYILFYPAAQVDTTTRRATGSYTAYRYLYESNPEFPTGGTVAFSTQTQVDSSVRSLTPGAYYGFFIINGAFSAMSPTPAVVLPATRQCGVTSSCSPDCVDNQGICDPLTSTCTCLADWFGAACEKHNCSETCGAGRHCDLNIGKCACDNGQLGNTCNLAPACVGTICYGVGVPNARTCVNSNESFAVQWGASRGSTPSTDYIEIARNAYACNIGDTCQGFAAIASVGSVSAVGGTANFVVQAPFSAASDLFHSAYVSNTLVHARGADFALCRFGGSCDTSSGACVCSAGCQPGATCNAATGMCQCTAAGLLGPACNLPQTCSVVDYWPVCYALSDAVASVVSTDAPLRFDWGASVTALPGDLIVLYQGQPSTNPLIPLAADPAIVATISPLDGTTSAASYGTVHIPFVMGSNWGASPTTVPSYRVRYIRGNQVLAANTPFAVCLHGGVATGVASAPCACVNQWFGTYCNLRHCPDDCTRSGGGACDITTGTCPRTGIVTIAPNQCGTFDVSNLGANSITMNWTVWNGVAHANSDWIAQYRPANCVAGICDETTYRAWTYVGTNGTSGTQLIAPGTWDGNPPSRFIYQYDGGNTYSPPGSALFFAKASASDCSGCSRDCAHGGICTSDTTCICVDGWSGPHCRDFNCSQLTCAPGTHCDASIGACTCFDGARTLECLTPGVPCPGLCDHGGRCDGGVGKCVCAGGWTGPTCGAHTCALTCQHGTCDTSVPACVCNANFTGGSCSDRTCPTDCLHGGACNGQLGTCACLAPYHGASCEKKACPVACLTGQRCDDTSGQCVALFSVTPAQSCIAPGTSVHILWSVLDSATVANPATDRIKMYTAGACGTLALGSVCPAQALASVAPAFATTSGAVDLFVPSAGSYDVFYVGANGAILTMNSVFVAQTAACVVHFPPCLNGGHADATTGACVCPVTTTGDICETHVCNCVNNGICDTTKGVCACPIGFTGVDCAGIVSSTQCLNGGSADVDHGTCNCAPGWTGADCGQAGCATPCSADKVCEVGSGTCVCPVGLTGPACDQTLCGFSGCSNHGTCGTSGACVCTDNWFGLSCEQHNCDVACDGSHSVCDTSQGVCVLIATIVQSSGPTCVQVPVDTSGNFHVVEATFGFTVTSGNHDSIADVYLARADNSIMATQQVVYSGPAVTDAGTVFFTLTFAAVDTLHAVMLYRRTGTVIATSNTTISVRTGPCITCNPPCFHGGGVCVAQDTCACSPGWSGPQCTACTVDACTAACSGHGVFSQLLDTCICDPGFVGSACNSTDCRSVSGGCANDGECSVTTGLCTCGHSWAGDLCRTPSTCGNFAIQQGDSENAVCVDCPAGGFADVGANKCTCVATSRLGADCRPYASANQCPFDCTAQQRCVFTFGACMCQVAYAVADIATGCQTCVASAVIHADCSCVDPTLSADYGCLPTAPNMPITEGPTANAVICAATGSVQLPHHRGYCVPCKNGVSPGNGASQCTCMPGTHGRVCEHVCATTDVVLKLPTLSGVHTACVACAPGTMPSADRSHCDVCPAGTYGIACSAVCPLQRAPVNGVCSVCVHGSTPFVGSPCVCNVGYYGALCEHAVGNGTAPPTAPPTGPPMLPPPPLITPTSPPVAGVCTPTGLVAANCLPHVSASTCPSDCAATGRCAFFGDRGCACLHVNGTARLHANIASGCAVCIGVPGARSDCSCVVGYMGNGRCAADCNGAESEVITTVISTAGNDFAPSNYFYSFGHRDQLGFGDVFRNPATCACTTAGADPARGCRQCLDGALAFPQCVAGVCANPNVQTNATCACMDPLRDRNYVDENGASTPCGACLASHNRPLTQCATACAPNSVSTHGGPCLSCQNGGTAAPDSARCNCTAGYSGVLCETSCAGVPVTHPDGTTVCAACAHGTLSGNVCGPCAVGWYGVACSAQCPASFVPRGVLGATECDACQHGTSVALGDPCVCNTGWQGRTCALQCPKGAVPAANDTICAPCLNGGNTLGPLSTTCMCPRGFTGPTCAALVCPVGSVPRLSDGRCVACVHGAPSVLDDPFGNLHCKCDPVASHAYWQGEVCTTHACVNDYVHIDGPSSTTCTACRNGGTAAAGPNSTCVCALGWSGPTCTAPPVMVSTWGPITANPTALEMALTITGVPFARAGFPGWHPTLMVGLAKSASLRPAANDAANYCWYDAYATPASAITIMRNASYVFNSMDASGVFNVRADWRTMATLCGTTSPLWQPFSVLSNGHGGEEDIFSLTFCAVHSDPTVATVCSTPRRFQVESQSGMVTIIETPAGIVTTVAPFSLRPVVGPGPQLRIKLRGVVNVFTTLVNGGASFVRAATIIGPNPYRINVTSIVLVGCQLAPDTPNTPCTNNSLVALAPAGECNTEVTFESMYLAPRADGFTFSDPAVPYSNSTAFAFVVDACRRVRSNGNGNDNDNGHITTMPVSKNVRGCDCRRVPGTLNAMFTYNMRSFPGILSSFTTRPEFRLLAIPTSQWDDVIVANTPLGAWITLAIRTAIDAMGDMPLAQPPALLADAAVADTTTEPRMDVVIATDIDVESFEFRSGACPEATVVWSQVGDTALTTNADSPSPPACVLFGSSCDLLAVSTDTVAKRMAELASLANCTIPADENQVIAISARDQIYFHPAADPADAAAVVASKRIHIMATYDANDNGFYGGGINTTTHFITMGTSIFNQQPESDERTAASIVGISLICAAFVALACCLAWQAQSVYVYRKKNAAVVVYEEVALE